MFCGLLPSSELAELCSMFRQLIRAGGQLPAGRVNISRFQWHSSIPSLDDSLIVTKSCVKRIKHLREKSGQNELHLRISVEGGGCSGFQYVFKMEDTPPSADEDSVFQKDGAAVVIDKSSLELVKGATVDYVQEMIRSSFAILNNPQSESACGCGSSFAVKNFAANPAID